METNEESAQLRTRCSKKLRSQKAKKPRGQITGTYKKPRKQKAKRPKAVDSGSVSGDAEDAESQSHKSEQKPRKLTVTRRHKSQKASPEKNKTS